MKVSKKEIEKIIEQEVEKKMRQREQTRNNEPEGRIEKPAKEESDSSLSRRRFLKTMAGGAVGFGAAAMIPSTAALRINSDKGLSYYNSSSAKRSKFEVDISGDITSMGSFNTGSTIPFQNGLQTQSNITDDNGITVYNKTKKTIGDGTTQANHQQINTDELLGEEVNKVFNPVKRGDGDLAAGFNDITQNEPTPWCIWIPPGDHDVTETLDLTDFKSLEKNYVIAYGADLNDPGDGSLSGKPIVELVGNGDHKWFGGNIRGRGDAAFGLLHARGSDSGGCTASISDLTIQGQFTKFAHYVLASEVNIFNNVKYAQSADTVTRSAGAGTVGLTSSDFANSVDNAVWSSPTGGSTTRNKWVGGSIRSYADTEVPDALVLSGSLRNTEFDGVFINGGENSAVRLRTEGRPYGVSGPIIFNDVRQEGNQDYSYHITGSNGALHLSWISGENAASIADIRAESRITHLYFEGNTGRGSGADYGIHTADVDIKHVNGNGRMLNSASTPISTKDGGGGGYINDFFLQGIDPNDIETFEIYRSIFITNQDKNTEAMISIYRDKNQVVRLTENGFVPQIQNLSGKTGSRDGETRMDSGANTSSRGILCTWDANNSVWVPQDGGTTFT